MIYKNSDFTLVKFNYSLYYILIQSLGRMLFLGSLILEELFSLNFSYFLFLFSLIIKLGLFPFHFWFYNFSIVCGSFIFFIILSIQKIPVLYLLFLNYSLELFYLLLVNIFIGLFYLYFCKNFWFGIISSSIYSVLWIFLFFFNSQFIYFYFFFLYSVCIFFLTKAGYIIFDFKKIFILSASLFLIRLPPFGIFFLKLNFLNFYAANFRNTLTLLIWILSFISLLFYVKIFFSFFLEGCSLLSNCLNFKITLKFLIPIFFIMTPLLGGL